MTYQVGNRVELHPGTDRWMMGDRYGEIRATLQVMGRTVYRIKLDRSNKTVRFREEDILRSVGLDAGLSPRLKKV